MKKLSVLLAGILLCVPLAACGSQKSTSSSSSSSSAKVVKHHSHKHKKHNNKNDQATKSSQNDQKQAQAAAQSGQQGKSQGEINRERGYDPNGAPLLPGQDHAAGDNPDGTPDPWVQGQIEWEIQNGYLNPDGTNTAKGAAAQAEVERNSQPGMP